jgi:ADP-ribose pyrophosphatase
METRVHKQQILRKGRVFDVTVENVTLANGYTVDLEVIRHPGASAIVPILENNQVLMLRQYRHAVGKSIWEIPAGTFDGKEDPMVCAQRELTEETGYSAQNWDRLGAITPVPGYSDETIHLFMASGLSPAKQALDKDEILEVHPLPLARVVEMIREGEIQDAKTIAAIFLTLSKKFQLEF